MHNFILSLYFFFHNTATTEIYTLSLHDALPILIMARTPSRVSFLAKLASAGGQANSTAMAERAQNTAAPSRRSEEHTSELQSQSNLVCRLLLEKKKLHSRLHFYYQLHLSKKKY